MDGAYYGSLGKRSYPSDGEAIERNGRQKRRTIGNSDQQTPSSEETEFRVLCPVSKIGSVIGKGGKIIKALRHDTRSKISVEDAVPGSDERVIYICSSAKEGRDSKSKDKDKDLGGEEMRCAAQEALFRVHAKIIEGFDEDGDEASRSVAARLLVPNTQVGCLLGKGGKIIEQMRKQIGGQIRVMPRDQLPVCASPNDELVQLSGDPAIVKKALYAVSSRLYENPARERYQGAPVPQGPTAPVGDPLIPTRSLYPQGGSFLAPSAVGGSLMGLGRSLAPIGSRVNSEWPLSSGLSVLPPISGPNTSQTEVGPAEEFTVRILCPNEKMGSMIGKGGSIIRKFREETGAKIQVGDPLSGSDERVINIISTEYMDSEASSAIDAALLVQKRLAELMTEKDKEVTTVTTRLLVPSNKVGCLLGKGGQIISEMRKSTRAKIQIPSKDELPPCAEENDELVQISGEPHAAQAALIQVLQRLRSNLFKGYDTGGGSGSGVLSSLSGVPLHGSTPILSGYGGRHELESSGYPLTSLGLTRSSNYLGYGSLPYTPSLPGRVQRDSRRRQK